MDTLAAARSIYFIEGTFSWLVYKPAMPREKALAIIREGRGTQFDPNLTDIFLAYMEKGKC